MKKRYSTTANCQTRHTPFTIHITQVHKQELKDKTQQQEQSKGSMSKVLGLIGDNAAQVDAVEAEAKLREQYPQLLLGEEKVRFAFADRGGMGRDSSYYTTHRIIEIDKKGLMGKKTDYLSIPNSSIKAFKIETAGTMDSDCELTIYAGGIGTWKQDFCTDMDLFGLQKHLNEHVLVTGNTGADIPTDPTYTTSTSGGGFFDWMGGNANQIDTTEVEAQLKKKQVLLPDEIVHLAFKCGRDSFLITSKRLLQIDVKGVSGRRVEYFSILWKSIRAFSVETAGSWDRDSELLLYTSLDNNTRIPMDFRKQKTDIFAVQKFLSDKLLGVDTVDASKHAISKEGHLLESFGNMFSWMGDDSRMMDAKKMDQQYHSNPPILQASETVEMAFKGRRDLMLFTSKRLLLVDLKGWSAKKVEYLTIPWTTVQAFGVTSAGSFMDKDAEMMIWTDFDDTFFPPQENPDNPPPPPIPRKSFLELDFQKDKVDLMTVHRYLSERCLFVDGGGLRPSDVPVSPDTMQPSPPNGVSSFLGWLGNDSHAIDPKKLDQQLHDVNPMLQDDEHVAMAYKAGRDTTIFTTKRILIMDTKGMSGKKIEWVSIPYTSLRAFSCESAGGWGDKDSELKLYCKIYWYASNLGSVIDLDFRKGRADIVAIQNFLSKQVMGSQDGSSALESVPTFSSAGGSGFNFLTDDGVQIDAKTVNEQLRNVVLLDDETVEVAFRIGRRDMCIFTTKRILMVDRQGFSGKKVEYLSHPYRYCSAFKVQAAGHLFSDAETKIYVDVPGGKEIRQDLKKSGSDIWAIQAMLAKKLLKA
jgi:hypothetical protein